jgi:hypothetical protein
MPSGLKGVLAKVARGALDPWDVPSSHANCGRGPSDHTERIALHIDPPLWLEQDRGLGKPDVIVADVYTTAALLEASRTHPDSFFASDKLVLYFDEPNMGIQVRPQPY